MCLWIVLVLSIDCHFGQTKWFMREFHRRLAHLGSAPSAIDMRDCGNFGASIAALRSLAAKKGYRFVGTNYSGNDAFLCVKIMQRSS
jgi:hypothetical protein